MRVIISTALIVFFLPVIAVANDAEFEIRDGFVRSSNARSAAAFMTIVNDSESDCTLRTASTDIAEKAELHMSKEDAQGMMMMQPIEGGIVVPAHGEQSLMRGGKHIMMTGLVAPLKQGDEVPLSLDFGKCGTVKLTLPLDNERK